MKKINKGFTLIELLVVVAIIGLLSSVIMVALGNARIKSRDARRLSDLQQMKSGLDIYYNLGTGYPDTASWNSAQDAFSQILCSGTPAFKVPQDPIHSTNAGYAYTYTQGGNPSSGCGGNAYTDYKIQFQTEGDTSYGPAGTYWLSIKGVTPSAPF